MKDEKMRDLLEVIQTNVMELRRELGDCRAMMSMLLTQDRREASFNGAPNGSWTVVRDNRLRESIIETIETLEESRKAFKSKKLEALRKKLTQVLIEVMN